MQEHFFISGSHPHSLREADITLILKKGKGQGYRPIAPLNLNIKLLSKILALRLERVSPFIIREDQTGFIKCRNSSHNVRRLLNIINLCQTHNRMVISLDAETTVSNGLICSAFCINLIWGKILSNGSNIIISP